MTGNGGTEAGEAGGSSAGALDERCRRLVALSAALAAGGDDRLARALDAAADAVATGAAEQGEVEEALLQAHLFLGYPAALAALEAWRERVPEPAPEDDPLDRPERVEEWEERGREVCRRVYGRAYPKLREKVAALHPAMDRWMVTEGYGKVLGRPGLPLADRELCIAALLAVRGREPQLHSHLRGALEVGARPGAVEAALELALKAAPEPRAAAARRVWRRVREGRTGGG